MVAKCTPARHPRNLNPRGLHRRTSTNHDTSAKIQAYMPVPSLPVELIEKVASNLDLSTLSSFRLTTRRHRNGTILIFKHRFFTTQYLSWTKSSLQRLIDISTHPELGDALQHLVIDATPHYTLDLWKMRRKSADAGHLTPLTDDEDGSKLTRQLSKQYETLSQEAEKAARWLRESRFDMTALKTAFFRTKTLESIVFSCSGMERRYSMFAHRYCESSQGEMSRPFVSTLHALASTDTAVRRIEIAPGKDYGAVSVGRLESLAPLFRALDRVFEALECLQLRLRDWRSPDSGFELESMRAPFSVRFLAKCRNVRVLDLSCYSELEEDLLGEVVRAGRFERLECVTLELLRVKSGTDLRAFLEPSERYLRELRLRHVLLDDPGSSWTKVLCAIADQETAFEALRILHVERLFTKQSSSIESVLFHDGTRFTSVLRFEGENWRDDLRKCGCRHVESEAKRVWESGAIAYPIMRSDSI